MTLLITVLAAVGATVVWYRTAPNSKMQVGLLCWLFWGASLMWLVDAIAEYAQLGAEYFTPDPYSMLNDTFLGISVIALALVIWLVRLLITDPRGVIRAKLKEEKITMPGRTPAAPKPPANLTDSRA